MRRHRRKGSTLVESAIVLLVFLVLLIAILDFGQIFFFHHFLNERVRSGVRYAVVHARDPQVVRNFVAYNRPTAGTEPLFGLAPSMVTVSRHDAGAPKDRIEVSVSTFTMRFLSPWLLRDFTPRPFRAVMPVEGMGAAE